MTDLLSRLETHVALKASSPGFHLSDADIEEILVALKAAQDRGLKPDFLSQTCEPRTPEGRREWFRREIKHAAGHGAIFHRQTIHPDNDDLLLYEGWRVPSDAALGPARFQLRAAP